MKSRCRSPMNSLKVVFVTRVRTPGKRSDRVRCLDQLLSSSETPMKLPDEFARRLSPRTLLVAALVLLGHSAGWAQNLTPAAQPAVGAAGVNSAYVMGSGFPAGAITGATVHLGTGCAA